MKRQKRNRNWVQDYFFLIVPKPFEDELLSSWLTRVALEHQRPLSVFLSLFVRHEGSAISRTDIDFLYDEKFLEQLARKSGLSQKDIYNMSLRSEEGYLFICSDCLYPPKQVRKLLDKRTHYGLMYCPKCLAEDSIPYFRKQWRYTFYNVCIKHKCYLTDRCWKCYKPIKLGKLQPDQDLSICSSCGYDLTKTIVTTMQSSEEKYGLKVTKWFESGLKKGYFKINHQKVPSVSIFESYTHLVALLDRKEKLILDNFPLYFQYKVICKELSKYSSRKMILVKKQFILSAMVYHLFQNFPKNLIDFANQNDLTHRDFVHGFHDIPFLYKDMIDRYIPLQNTIGREISESEVAGAIKFLKSEGKIVNQKNVADIVGCHFTKNKGYVKIYKVIALNFQC